MTRPLRVALCSSDPIGITTFDSFDPDSFSVMSIIADALILIDSEGEVKPALATSWERTSPLAMEFELRRGVRFHDGSEFSAEDVVATFDAHRSPTPSACGGGILSPIVDVTALGPHRVRIETAFPDGMLLRRLFFGQVYAQSVLRRGGRDAIARHPVTTGPYRFVRWDRGEQIVLERNPEHWAQTASVDRIELPIIKQKEWIDRLVRGEIDVALNVDAHDAVRARRISGLITKSRSASVNQGFLLRNQGPLADVRVRLALNHALQRKVLVELSEHGLGAAQRSVSTPHEEGFVECEAHRYSPERARQLLHDAGYADGLQLRGLVSETSTALYFACREFLERVGVHLQAEIVPSAEWMSRIVLNNLRGVLYDCDFALTSFSNPLSHALFLQFANVFSGGPGSLTRDANYDAEFMKAATEVEPLASAAAIARLERFAADRALMLFTVHQHTHAVMRPGCNVDLPRTGIPTGSIFSSLRVSSWPSQAPLARLPKAEPDSLLLLEGVSNSGTFYLPKAASFEQPINERIWANITLSQERWHLQAEPLLRQVVSLVESKEHLLNVLGSTDRVAIVGYTYEGRRLFVNRGHELMLGTDPRPISERLARSGDKSWPAIREQVETTGSFLGPVDVEVDGTHRSFYLTVAPALDDERVRVGYTFVFSDFSGEEERIKNNAIRNILDNVPYALFACDHAGRVQPGYSAKCRDFFSGASVEGQTLVELLGLSDREAATFHVCYEQLMEDFLPTEVSLAQLPSRLHVGDRVCDLSGSVLRDGRGKVCGALFTLLDVTELTVAEEEAGALRGTIKVLRFRASFESFVRDLDRELGRLRRRVELEAADVDAQARRTLHTAKGVFAQFDLRDLAHKIHVLEDAPKIGAAELAQMIAAVRATVEGNAAYWGIRLGEVDARFVVLESDLKTVSARLADARTLDEARSSVEGWLESLRKKPLAELIGPIEESCRAQATRLGKQVHVRMEGFDLAVSLHLLPIVNSLTHLTRNAIDHAIEPPEERGEKSRCGLLALRAQQAEGSLVLEVSDDGRGVDLDAVVRRAVAARLLSADDARNLSRAETLDLLFLDGLSTKDQVSETSGRGVGLSAVRDAARAAGGSIQLQTEPGRGTRFVLCVPLERPAPALN
jgi:ABC-type transport system substrate-binding protein/signal transduction histidine kinase